MALPRMLRAALPWVPVVAVGGLAAYFEIFTFFPRYDDEGSMLISLSEFVHGGELYDQVYSQYGPFYYLLFGGLFELSGRPVTTDASRLIVVAVWVATATLHGIAVYRLTGRLWLGVAAQLVAFMTLVLLIAEPMHPVGVNGLLLAAALVCAARPSGRATGAAVGLGLLVAALTMTKVNVGALAAVAVLVAAVLTLPELRNRAASRYAALALLVLTPLAFFGPDLGEEWVQEFLVVFAGGLLAALITVAPARAAEAQPSAFRWLAIFASAGVAAALAFALAIVALGSSVGRLVDALVVEPSKLRDVFVLPLPLPDAAVDWAILAVIAAVAVRTFPQRTARLPAAWPAVLRIAAGFAIWASVTNSAPVTVTPGSGRMVIPLLLAWIAAAPAHGETEAPWAAFARVFVVLLAVLQTLQAYPVAGTQVTAAALMFVPVGGLLVADGVRGLEAAGAARSLELGRWAAILGVAIVAGLVAKFAIGGVLRPLQASADAYANTESLGLEGADRLHFPAADTAEYQRLAAHIREDCDRFISVPGLNSFYLWTGQRPPTGMNVGDWMFLLDDEQQQRVVDAVRGVERLCLLRSDEGLANWVSGSGKGAPPDLPLIRVINQTRWREIDSALNGYYRLFLRRR